MDIERLLDELVYLEADRTLAWFKGDDFSQYDERISKIRRLIVDYVHDLEQKVDVYQKEHYDYHEEWNT